MYIKKEDFAYFEGLLKNLDEAGQGKFANLLRKAGSEKAGAEITKIKVIDDSIYDVQGIDPSDIITRTMIKKAYKAVKEEGHV